MFRDRQERPAKFYPYHPKLGCRYSTSCDSSPPRAIFGWSDEKKPGRCWRVLVLVRVRPRLDIIYTNAHPCDRPKLFQLQKSAKPYRPHPAIHGTAIADLTRVQSRPQTISLLPHFTCPHTSAHSPRLPFLSPGLFTTSLCLHSSSIPLLLSLTSTCAHPTLLPSPTATTLSSRQ